MNKHIRFDDEENSDNEIINHDKLSTDVDMNFNDEKNGSKKINLTVILKKDIKTQDSFGFQLMGNQNEKGNHYVSVVEPNSPSARANLKPLDKIIKVNGFDVGDFTITSLIEYLEYEMSLNEFKLLLLVERTLNAGEIKSEDDKCSTSHDNNKRKKNKEKNLNYKSSNEKKDTANNNQISIMEGLMPAVELERIFNSNLTDAVNQTSSIKTLEEIRREKIDEIRFLAPERPVKQSNVPSKFTLNLKAKEFQIKLSKQNKYVSWKEIIYELLQHYECQHIGELDLKQADYLETISTLIRLQKKIDTFIISYDSRVSCVCLLDLEDAICHDYNYAISKQYDQNSSNNNTSNQLKINKFEEINIGPLIKNQIVRQLFKIADNITSIRQLKPIKLIDVMKNLHSFLEENNFWSKKVKDNEFERYLIEKYKVNTIHDLCVKINNIGLLVGTIKSVQHVYSNSIKNVRVTLASELEQLICNEKAFLLKNLNDKLAFYKKAVQSSHNENYEYEQINTRLNYLKMDSVNLVADFIEIFEKLFDKSDFEPVSNFLYLLKSNKFMADAFQIAIGFAKSDYYLELVESKFEESYDNIDDKYTHFLKKIFEVIFKWRFEQYENRHKKLAKDIRRFFNSIFCKNGIQLHAATCKKYFADDNDVDLRMNQYQENLNEEEHQLEKEDLDEKFSNFVRNKLEPNSILKFEHLIRMENYIFGKSRTVNFIELLFKNIHLLQSKNLSIILNENDKRNLNELNEFEIHDLLSYIKQINSTLKKMNLKEDLLSSELSQMIFNYYSIKSIDQLGYGHNLNSLIDQADREISSNIVNVVYQDSLFYSIGVNNSTTHLECNKSKEMKRDKVIDLLNKCPLLENIYEYLNWDQEYEKTFGKLKEFLNSLNDLSFISNQIPFIDLLQLNLGDKYLYKLTRQTDILNLKSSIENGDFVNTAGHLVSLISLKYGTLFQTPRSLICNEMQSSLSIYLDKCIEFSPANKHLNYLNLTTKLNGQFSSFVVDLIFRIPFKILIQIIFNYIIDPLINMEGNHDVKKDIFIHTILKSYETNQNYYKLNREKSIIIDDRIKHLIKVGQTCSITEWSIENYFSILNVLIEKTNLSNSLIEKETYLKKEKFEENINIELHSENKSLLPKTSILNKTEKILKHQTFISSKNDFKNQFEHIELIRKRYGIGIQLDDQTKSVTESLKGVIGRSLESLSNELYNKDMHFVLELIQNADDNNYIKDSNEVEPTLVFILEKDHIILLNNEIGFTEQNINAICDVKASTKGKHQRGYIGRKGIGFKSVFTISNSPEIHSNGYHINFDLDNGHIGYILPNWISDVNKLDKIESSKTFAENVIRETSQDLLNKIGRFNTVIRLPFKPESEIHRDKSSVINNNFNDIKPYLLLFLNRLRNLIIINNVENSLREIVYHRNDINENMVEIKSNQINEISHKWLVVKEVIKIPSNLKPSEEVESTDLCLAFPLQNLDKKSLPKMDVFAYLPLRSFGFTFIIQADFVIPASRQDINQDSEWNQYICKQISNLFVKSLKYFKEHSIFNGSKLDSIKAYLRFLPLEEEIVGFFSHIPSEIIEKLRNEPFLPVDSDEVDGEILWKKPFECVIVNNDEFIKQVLTSDLLKKYLGRYYLHLSMVNSNEISQQLLYKLGVKNLGLNDLLEILKNVFSQNDFRDITSTAKWLVVLEHCLNNFSLNKEEKFIKQLNEFEFIPVVVNSSNIKKTVSLSKETIFFPLTKASNPITKLIEKELTILDVDLLLCLDDVKNAQIINFLKNLGVKQIEPNEIIDLLIKNKKLENITEENSILYIIYIHDIFFSNNSNSFSHLSINLDKLKESLLLKTNKGFKKIVDQDEENSIYLTKAYGNKYDFEILLPSYNWILIDPIYLKKSLEYYGNGSSNYELSNKLMLSWRKFFITFGLNDIFEPKLKQTIIRANELDTHDYYKQYSSLLNLIRIDESYVFNDYDCPIFNHYFSLLEKSDTVYIKELTNLFRLVEEYWENKLSNFKYVSVGVISAKEEHFNLDSLNRQCVLIIKENLCETIYFRNLKTKPWICVEINQFIDTSCISNLNKFELKTITKLEKPNKTFIKEQVFIRYYGLHVPYTINCPYKDKSNFGRDINLKYEFDLIEFLTTFKEWIESSKIFYASFLQMRNIYYLISNQLNSFESKKDINQLCKNFIVCNKPFIFVPFTNDEIDNSKEKIVPGLFVPLNEVYWSDSTHLFEIYKKNSNKFSDKPILLEPFYFDKIKGEQTKQIFLNDFRISLSPTISDYIDLLEHISLLASVKKSSESDELIRHVFMLYEILVDKYMELTQVQVQRDKPIISDSTKNNFLNLIKYKKIIPCLNNQWMSLENNDTKRVNHLILVDNDFDLAEKFSDRLNIVMIPKNSLLNDSFYSDNSFKSLCDADNLNQKLKYFFYELLELKSFKQIVILELENITESLREAPQVQYICREILPFIQFFLYYRVEFKSSYKKFINMNEKLEKMKFYSVKQLQNIYRCLHDPNIQVNVSNKTCLDIEDQSKNWIFYVRADILENKIEIIKGFAKLFLKIVPSLSNDKNEKELIKFCLFINQFNNFKISDEDKNEIEKDYNLKFFLPENEEEWHIPEPVQILKRSLQETNEISNNYSILPTKSINISNNHREEINKTSKRQKIIELEKISQNQINDPSSVDFYKRNFEKLPNSINLPSEKNLNAISTSMQELAQKMHTNFSLYNLNERDLLIDANIKDESYNEKEMTLIFDKNLSILSQQIKNNEALNADQEIENNEYRYMIGRWGEVWVFEMLKLKFKSQLNNNLLRLEWMNEHNESGLPYDFRITKLQNVDDDIHESYNIKYIEVKSTNKSTQEIIPISYQELLFAQEFSNQFEIYRVYNAGSNRPNNTKLKIIKNVPTLLNSHCANLYMVI